MVRKIKMYQHSCQLQLGMPSCNSKLEYRDQLFGGVLSKNDAKHNVLRVDFTQHCVCGWLKLMDFITLGASE